MAKDKKKGPELEREAPETAEPVAREETQAPEETHEAEPAEDPMVKELEALKDTVAQQEEKYLRLCAEYDNYRKRTTREKDAAWQSSKGDTAKAFLGIYDDLERALKQETQDEAYRKGVEMILTKFRKTLGELGIEEIPALGETFDANLHNAVMHVEDPDLGENTVKEVFQAGFKLGDQVLRYAMVVVAN